MNRDEMADYLCEMLQESDLQFWLGFSHNELREIIKINQERIEFLKQGRTDRFPNPYVAARSPIGRFSW